MPSNREYVSFVPPEVRCTALICASSILGLAKTWEMQTDLHRQMTSLPPLGCGYHLVSKYHPLDRNGEKAGDGGAN